MAWEFDSSGGNYTGRLLIDGEVYSTSEASKKFGSVANRRNESDRLGRSCDGTGQRCSRVDISNPKSSSCAFDGIFDMR